MKNKTTKNVLLAVALLCGAAFTAQAQFTIFNETFNSSPPFPDGSTLTFNGDTFGDTTSETYGQVSGIGVGGNGVVQLQLDAASGSDGYSGASVTYANGSLSGNSSSSLSDYTLSFYAQANAGSLALILQSWSGNFASYQGQLNTYPGIGYGNDLALNPSYTLYSLNLGNNSTFQSGAGFQPNGGSIEITFQLDGGGPTPYTDTLDISDLELTMVPEPASATLCALGGLAALAFLRQRKS